MSAPRLPGIRVCCGAINRRAAAPFSAVCEPVGYCPRAEAAAEEYARGAAQVCETLHCKILPTMMQRDIADGPGIPRMPCMITRYVISNSQDAKL